MKIEHEPDSMTFGIFDGYDYGGLDLHASPHECSVPDCPGDRNRQRLELFERYKRELEGLTPGGSEFVDDPERCSRFVRESRDSQMSGMQMWAKRAKANEANLELWDEMLQSAENFVAWVDDCWGSWAINESFSEKGKSDYEKAKAAIAKAKELK